MFGLLSSLSLSSNGQSININTWLIRLHALTHSSGNFLLSLYSGSILGGSIQTYHSEINLMLSIVKCEQILWASGIN